MKVVGAEQLEGGLPALAPIAEAVFEGRPRSPGWFARKLAREGVEAELSAIVREGPRILGYALLGRARSRGPVARGAGLGLVEPIRGQGWGRALVDRVAARARARGCDAIEFLAEHERLAWYRSQGFTAIRREQTLAALGTGSELDLARAACTPATALGSAPLWSWFPEAWHRTPPGHRLVLDLGCGRVWMIRESRAWIAVRAELAPEMAPAELLALLRSRLDRNTRLVLYPCPAASGWVERALGLGFECIQSATLVRRPT